MQGHKSLEAWKSAHAVVSGVFDSTFAAPHPRAYPIYDQLRRAALSVQLNIAEGYAMQSGKAFKRYLVIAYGSAIETGDVLELIIEKALGPERLAKNILADALRTQRLLLGLIRRYTPKG
jgi:four helix bundle protein